MRDAIYIVITAVLTAVTTWYVQSYLSRAQLSGEIVNATEVISGIGQFPVLGVLGVSEFIEGVTETEQKSIDYWSNFVSSLRSNRQSVATFAEAVSQIKKSRLDLQISTVKNAVNEADKTEPKLGRVIS